MEIAKLCKLQQIAANVLESYFIPLSFSSSSFSVSRFKSKQYDIRPLNEGIKRITLILLRQ